MAYTRHDVDNNPAAVGVYSRHDEDNVIDSPQPTYTEATDSYGNTYRNYNGDYVGHDVDNNPDVVVPLSGIGNSTLSGTLQDGQTLTVVTDATFSDGAAPVTTEYQWQISDTGTGSWSGWGVSWTSYDTTIVGETKVIATADVGKYVRVQQRATDNDSVVVIRAGIVSGPILA